MAETVDGGLIRRFLLIVSRVSLSAPIDSLVLLLDGRVYSTSEVS